MAMQQEPFELMEGQGFPTVRQISVFLDNRMGQLLRLTQVLDEGNVKILALSVIDSIDCAIIRMVFDLPDRALTVLRKAGFAVSITEIVVVIIPPGKRGMMTVFSSLLTSEINVFYAYPLLPAEVGTALALSVDNSEIAVDTLQRHGFEVLGEADLI